MKLPSLLPNGVVKTRITKAASSHARKSLASELNLPTCGAVKCPGCSRGDARCLRVLRERIVNLKCKSAYASEVKVNLKVKVYFLLIFIYFS